MLSEVRTWLGLQRRALEVQTAWPGDDLVVTDPRQVRRDLEDVARSRRIVAWRSTCDRFAGTGLLRLGPGPALELRAQPGQPSAGPMPTGALNATVSGERGLLLFTLFPNHWCADAVLQAAMPSHIIRMQSRRHFRVRGLNGPTHHVQLVMHGVGAPVRVLDISESGIGFELGAGEPVLPQELVGVRLALDGAFLAPAKLHVIHQRVMGSARRVGAQVVNLGSEDLRMLRRWMAAAQAACVAPAQA